MKNITDRSILDPWLLINTWVFRKYKILFKYIISKIQNETASCIKRELETELEWCSKASTGRVGELCYVAPVLSALLYLLLY